MRCCISTHRCTYCATLELYTTHVKTDGLTPSRDLGLHPRETTFYFSYYAAALIDVIHALVSFTSLMNSRSRASPNVFQHSPLFLLPGTDGSRNCPCTRGDRASRTCGVRSRNPMTNSSRCPRTFLPWRSVLTRWPASIRSRPTGKAELHPNGCRRACALHPRSNERATPSTRLSGS